MSVAARRLTRTGPERAAACRLDQLASFQSNASSPASLAGDGIRTPDVQLGKLTGIVQAPRLCPATAPPNDSASSRHCHHAHHPQRSIPDSIQVWRKRSISVLPGLPLCPVHHHPEVDCPRVSRTGRTRRAWSTPPPRCHYWGSPRRNGSSAALARRQRQASCAGGHAAALVSQ